MLDALEGLAPALAGPRVSPLFRTRPVGPSDQPDYLNAAVTGATHLSPEELLGLAKALEYAAGRRPGRRFGPRPLDVDLLLYGDRVERTPALTLPHPRLAERRFYLEPLARIAAELPVPPAGETVSELLDRTDAEEGIVEVPWSDDPARPVLQFFGGRR